MGSGHCGKNGVNAVHHAGPLLVDLLNRDYVTVNIQGLEFREVMSVTLANGGTARNVIPANFVMTINYRYAPGKDESTARQELLDIVDGRVCGMCCVRHGITACPSFNFY